MTMKPNYFHQDLANGGWEKLGFAEQMANIGSEVERTIKWKNKGKTERSKMAFFRALELMDFTIGDKKNRERLRSCAGLGRCSSIIFFQIIFTALQIFFGKNISGLLTITPINKGMPVKNFKMW